MLKKEYSRIVEAVVRKAQALCPYSLELIGVYGSCATGDTHERSDLDLLILIRDEAGRCLSHAFILEDTGIGFDLYCTTWDMLERDAACTHPHLGKLMDSHILYVGNPEAPARLKALRQHAAEILSSDKRFDGAIATWERAKGAYAECCLASSLPEARLHAAGVIQYLIEALMLGSGHYFRKGVKRTFEELSEAGIPFDLQAVVTDVIACDTVEGLREGLTSLMRTVRRYLTACRTVSEPKSPPAAANLAGTYEEMVSNWKGKMAEAAKRGHVYASFMNMASLAAMLEEIGAEVDIHRQEVMAGFDPRDLAANAARFDAILEQYREEYRRAGISPQCYADTDAFLTSYLGGI